MLLYIFDLGKAVRRGRAADGRVFDPAEEGPPSARKVDRASDLVRARARAQKRHSHGRG